MKSQTFSSTTSLNFPKDEFSKGVFVSLLAHVILVSFFVLKTYVFSDDVIDYSQAIRVDIVGLPEKLKPEQLTPKTEEAKAEPKPEPKVEEPVKAEPLPKVAPKPVAKPLPVKKDPDTISLEKTKKKEKEALQKLKTLSAIERIQQELEKEKKSSKPSKPILVKGNVLAPGTELTGLDRLQHENYAADLDRHVKQYWSLPQWLAKKGYKGQAIVRIDEKGRVISREIIKSSGNPNFDESVLETIDQANPLPAPPEKLSAKVRVEGILIGFGE